MDVLPLSEIVIFMIDGNKTLCRPVQSVIILAINKSDSRCAVVRLCHRWYDYRLFSVLLPVRRCDPPRGVRELGERTHTARYNTLARALTA